MSEYQANIVTRTPATPGGPSPLGAAPGVWRLNDVAAFIKQGVWPDPNVDGYWAYTSLLLSTTSLGNANNNLFVDSSGAFNPVSRNGNTTQGSFTPYAANWSNYFDGSGDWIDIASNAAFGFGTGDYTVDFWLYLNALPSSGKYTLVDFRPSSSAVPHTIYVDASGYLGFFNGSADVTSSSTPMSANTWTYIAYSRSSGTLRIYVNGVQAYSAANTIDYLSSRPCRIGAAIGGIEGMNGYVSNFRIIKGTGLYTSAFTPPTAALTSVSGTSLLTCQSNRFRDASSNNFTITPSGNVSVQEFNPFILYPSPITYNQSDITNWSGYFDGSGDYLSIPSSSSLNFGTGNWTIECWVYVSTRTTNYPLLFGNNRGAWTTDALALTLSNADSASYNDKFVFAWNNAGFSSPSAGTSQLLVANVTNNKGTWYHFAAVRNGTSVKMYRDGVEVASATVSAAATFSWGYNGSLIGGGNWDGASSYMNGYVSNLRVTSSAVYTAAFTPPTSALTAISGTVYLTCQNPAFTDNSTNNFVITINGNTTVTGNSPFNTVGYWSNYFDGNGDYLSFSGTSALNQSGDFTIEAWIYLAATPSAATPIYAFETNNFMKFGINTSRNLVVDQSNVGIKVTGSTALNLNTWYHMAFVRSGSASNNCKIYLNGVQEGQFTDTSSVTVSGTGRICSRTDLTSGFLTCYLSNLRVTNTAVYTSAFTPSTTPLTAISGTQLLTCQSSRFIDSSANAIGLTSNGDVSVQSFDPFYTSTIASNGGSSYFDNTGDYLAIPASPALALGSSAFTLEAWVYGSGSWSTDPIFECRASGGSSSGYAFLVNSSGYLNVYTAGAFVGNSSTTLNLNSWNHVALVRTSTGSNQTTYYINGVASGTITLSGNFTDAITNETKIGGSTTAGENWNGYIASARITKAAVYTTAFTPSTTPLTPSANTVLLVNGMNAGIYDATAINDMETVGNAQVRFPTPFAPANYYAGAFDGSGDYARISSSQTALQFGTGDFTVEGWVYSTGGTGTYQQMLTGGTSWTSGSGGVYWYYNGGAPYVGAAWNQIATNPAVNSGTLAINTWHHFAVVRSGNTLTLYVNGTSVDTLDVTGVSMAVNNQSQTNIGGGGWDQDFAGYLSNLRVVKGTAVYTSNFTPSTTPLTAISGTSLLTCQNKTFIDNSTNAFTITAFGNATAGAIGPFPGTGGTSVYFDGSGDYLLTPSNPAYALSGTSFTIEAWVYVTSSSEPYQHVVKGVGSGGNNLMYIDYSGGSTGVLSSQSGGTVATRSGVTLNTWHHLAVVRNGTSVTCYVNGVGGTPQTIDPGSSGSVSLLVGYDGGTSPARYFNGYMDDLRITKGVARYTANFTPPTAPFPTY